MILACMKHQMPARLQGTGITEVSELPEGRDYEISGFSCHIPHEEIMACRGDLMAEAPNLMVWNGQRHMPILTLK